MSVIPTYVGIKAFLKGWNSGSFVNFVLTTFLTPRSGSAFLIRIRIHNTSICNFFYPLRFVQYLCRQIILWGAILWLWMGIHQDFDHVSEITDLNLFLCRDHLNTSYRRNLLFILSLFYLRICWRFFFLDSHLFFSSPLFHSFLLKI
jgi:hypothetical protein